MKAKGRKYPASATPAEPLHEVAAALESAALRVNVRAAKDRLSSLLEIASQGREVVITSDGEPKAKLVSWRMKPKRFKVDWALLKSIPVEPGTKSAQEIIREERDGRP